MQDSCPPTLNITRNSTLSSNPNIDTSVRTSLGLRLRLGLRLGLSLRLREPRSCVIILEGLTSVVCVLMLRTTMCSAPRIHYFFNGIVIL